MIPGFNSSSFITPNAWAAKASLSSINPIVLSMIVPVSFGADQLDEVITEEESNIVYRNSIDFDTKTTQVWWDSAWHNKWQWLKSYDDSGYLTESEFYKFRNCWWYYKS